LLPDRFAVDNTRPILLVGRPPIVINAIFLENLLVIKDGIYTLVTHIIVWVNSHLRVIVIK